MNFSVPFDRKIFKDFGLFVVPVLTENQGRSLYIPMIVDSAATYVTLRPDVFEELGIRAVREVPLVTASQRTGAGVGRVDKMTAGGQCSATNVEVISLSLPEALPAEGLLGTSFLRHFLVSMDYVKGELQLSGK